jgi:hypothetical protein
MRTRLGPIRPEHLRDCGSNLVASLGANNDFMKGARRTDPERCPMWRTRSTSRRRYRSCGLRFSV